MILWSFKCDTCDMEEERIVQKQEEGVQVCNICGTVMSKILSPNPGWLISKERTYAMLKKRSHDHSARCKAKGISMSDNDSGISSDPVWRNKTRAKNTSRTTIEKFKDVHKTWNEKPRIEQI